VVEQARACWVVRGGARPYRRPPWDQLSWRIGGGKGGRVERTGENVGGVVGDLSWCRGRTAPRTCKAERARSQRENLDSVSLGLVVSRWRPSHT